MPSSKTKSDGGGAPVFPECAACDHSVGNDQQLSGAGDQRDFRRVTALCQAFIKRFQHRAVARGTNRGGHVERALQPNPAAADMNLAW